MLAAYLRKDSSSHINRPLYRYFLLCLLFTDRFHIDLVTLMRIQQWIREFELPEKPYFQEKLEKVFISTSVLMISELKDQWPANSGWKLYFTNYFNNTINTTLKSIGLLRKLSIQLPRQIFLTIYKSFTRPLLDCGDVIYDLSLNDSLSNRIETVQYKSALAITGAIQGSSREKIYQDLRLD